MPMSPGPWTQEEDDEVGHIIRDADKGWVGTGWTEDDARAIAALPDMLGRFRSFVEAVRSLAPDEMKRLIAGDIKDCQEMLDQIEGEN